MAEREAWLAAAVGERARVVRTRPIGVSSTAMDAVDIADRRGRIHRLALRRYTDAARLKTDPVVRPAKRSPRADPVGEHRRRRPASSTSTRPERHGRARSSHLTHSGADGVTAGGHAPVLDELLERWCESTRFLRLRRGPARPRALHAGSGDPPARSGRRCPACGSASCAWSPPHRRPDRGFIHRDIPPRPDAVRAGRLRGVVDWTTRARAHQTSTWPACGSTCLGVRAGVRRAVRFGLRDGVGQSGSAPLLGAGRLRRLPGGHGGTGQRRGAARTCVALSATSRRWQPPSARSSMPVAVREGHRVPWSEQPTTRPARYCMACGNPLRTHGGFSAYLRLSRFRRASSIALAGMASAGSIFRCNPWPGSSAGGSWWISIWSGTRWRWYWKAAASAPIYPMTIPFAFV